MFTPARIEAVIGSCLLAFCFLTGGKSNQHWRDDRAGVEGGEDHGAVEADDRSEN